jgi:hypothetical protein
MSYFSRAFFMELAAVVALCLAFSVPFLARAQTAAAPQNDLRSAIRAELLSDPRTAGLSGAQLEGMVNLLTQEAQKRGVTAHDIAWHPQQRAGSGMGGQNSETMAISCGVSPFLCTLDEAFGFIGPDTTIPFSLGAASMGLIWIIAETLHRRRNGIHSKL